MTVSKELESSQSRFPMISFLVALIGTALSMWGASWDITSHLLRTPETFFTPSHGVLYLGVGISVASAALSLLLMRNKKRRTSNLAISFKLILIGTLIQIIAGPGDFFWHEQFGIDGLLSPTHITLALGIMMVLIGAVIGLGRLYLNSINRRFLRIIVPISFGIFWFSVMWLIFFFVLPISEGDTHNFNPDPVVAIVLGTAVIPFAFSVVFWSSFRTMGTFGAASAAALSFITMNITSNILTSEGLLNYLPWFIAPMVCAVGADYLLNNGSNITKHYAKLSGIMLGSMFFLFCFPMLSMSFLEFYVYNDVFPYDVLPSSPDTVFSIWLMTIVPGAISGMFGMMFASKKIKFNETKA